ncbi:MAG: hypothetical protein ACRDAM_00130 [Casimicrobium sp.]
MSAARISVGPSRSAAATLSFAMGFLSLSQEILWVRLFGFANLSTPKAFAFVLAIYLFGIALGAWIGRKYCLSASNLPYATALTLTLVAVIDLVAPRVYVAYQSTSYAHVVAAVAIFLTAAGKSIIFPIAHHLGTAADGDRVGRSFSRVYASNVAGATLGPLVTGYILLEYLTIGHAFNLIAALTLACAIWWFILSERLSGVLAAVAIAAAGVSWVSTKEDPLRIVATGAPNLKTLVQNRAGVVHIVPDEKNGDVVLGGNVYDGRINLDVYRNSNLIHRTLALSALKPDAKRILIIGLSTGAWLRLIESFPGVQHIDVVEINPGYLKAIADYPDLQQGLDDKRVNLIVDDGRRWLRRNPDKQYDLIVMNTTWSWRAYASGLLSREFLALVNSHMHENSLLAFNSTVSPDAVKTAGTIFAHTYRYENFVFASHIDFRMRLTRSNLERTLSTLRWDHKTVLDRSAEANHKVIDRILQSSFETVADVEQKTGRKLEVITDHNLLPEYKYGRAHFSPDK